MANVLEQWGHLCGLASVWDFEWICISDLVRKVSGHTLHLDGETKWHLFRRTTGKGNRAETETPCVSSYGTLTKKVGQKSESACRSPRYACISVADHRDTGVTQSVPPEHFSSCMKQLRYADGPITQHYHVTRQLISFESAAVIISY